MAVDERRRHSLYRKLEEVLGADEAGTLMDHLPPVGWADVARKSDIEALRREIGSEIGSVRREMVHLEDRLSDRFEAKIESKLNSQTKTLVTLMSAQVVAVAGLAFAAARLA